MMTVLIQIDGREAIPVRAIPLLTHWRFMSPDIVCQVLGSTAGSNVGLFGDLQAYRMEGGGFQPIKKDWWVQFPLKKLQALSKKIRAAEPIDEVGYSEWQQQSLKELPAGAFVWQEDYQRLHDRNWNGRFQMTYCALRDRNGEEADDEVDSQLQCDLARDMRRDDLVDNNPLKRQLRESLEILKRWREPDYCPFMSQELNRIVMEGFDSPTEHAPAKVAAIPAPEPVAVVAASDAPLTTAPAWCLKRPTRFQGYGKPLYDFLRDAHIAGQPKPNARDLLDSWKSKPPLDVVEVNDNGLKYYDAKGNTKPADLEAIRKTINRMTR